MTDIREKYTEEQLEEMFDEMLDDTGEEVKIGYSTFYPSQILANCDPIAYRIGLDEFIDYLQEQEDE